MRSASVIIAGAVASLLLMGCTLPITIGPEFPAPASANRRTFIVLVQGAESRYDPKGGILAALVDLAVQDYGYAPDDMFPFSYLGGVTEGHAWRPEVYELGDANQSYYLASRRLRQLVVWLKEGGDRVAVVGFGLGGLVAVDSLRSPEDERADIVVALASPLKGLNRHKFDHCGAIGRLWDDWKAGHLDQEQRVLQETYALLCLNATLRFELEVLARTPTLYETVAEEVNSDRRRLLAIGSSNDCLYWLAICSINPESDDVDWRFSNFLDAASRLELTAPPRERSACGICDLVVWHQDLAAHPAALRTGLDFIGRERSQAVAHDLDEKIRAFVPFRPRRKIALRWAGLMGQRSPIGKL